MIIDECLLVLVHSQAEPTPPRPTNRSAAARRSTGFIPQDVVGVGPAMPMHSIGELSLVGRVDAMPAMQTIRRMRAPTSMATRPRLGHARAPVQGKLVLPRERTQESIARRDAAATPTTVTPRKPRTPRVKSTDAPSVRRARRGKCSDSAVRSAPAPHVVTTYHSLIANLQTPDASMKARAIEIASRDISSEPVLPINTAIRIVLQATLDLGRPYDTNMLAATFGITRSLVMQSLRKYYKGFMEQSLFTEELFVPTYLWLYGLGGDTQRVKKIVRAIKLSGAAEPGSRSVFAIARDFVILYVTEVMHGVEVKCELAGLSSVAAVMASITPPTEAPTSFVEMTNSFLYRARMTGRSVVRAQVDDYPTVGSLFADD